MDKTLLEPYIKLLPLGKSISFTEAERRAGLFLEAMAKITEWRLDLAEHKIKLLSAQTAVYAEQLSLNDTGKIMADRVKAEASDEYRAAREELESVDNSISYLKAMYDIMTNGHIFYRNQAKGDNA